MPARKTTAAKTSAAKAAKKPAAKPVPTLDKPLASGWVRQSTVPLSEELAVSKFTTQAQRRILRAIVRGEDDAPTSTGDLAPQTMRTIDRLKGLGLVSVSKTGAITATKAGSAFVAERSPAPIVRAPKPAAKPAAKKPATKASAKPVAKKRTVRRSAAKVAA
jgi:hypothetical protein